MSTILPVLGAASGAAGSIESGFAQANSANYQAAVARNNAQIAHQNALYSAGASSAQIQQQEEKGAQQQGNVRGGIAANGIDVNSGSAVDVQSSQREIGALDSKTTASRDAETVYGYQTQQQNFTNQSTLDATQASGDIAGGFLKAGSVIGNAVPQLPKAFGWMGGNSPGPVSYTDADGEGAEGNFPEFY